jgi:hypothetical protein
MEEKKTPIVIDDVEHFFEDMTTEQQAIINHLTDLDRKISNTQFNLDQLRVGRNAFVEMLKVSMTPMQEVLEPTLE